MTEDRIPMDRMPLDHKDVAVLIPALNEYTRLRLPRTSLVARRSRRAGRMYSAPYGAQVLAARLLGLAPGRAVARGLDTVVDWRPPAG